MSRAASPMFSNSTEYEMNLLNRWATSARICRVKFSRLSMNPTNRGRLSSPNRLNSSPSPLSTLRWVISISREEDEMCARCV